MKKTIKIASLILLTTSCEKVSEFHPFDKKDKKETVCPTIDRSVLPSCVLSNFEQKYNGASSITWFDKDGNSYCAVFQLNGKEMKASFSKEGILISEDIEDNEEARDENEEDEMGCDCEVNDDDENEDEDH